MSTASDEWLAGYRKGVKDAEKPLRNRSDRMLMDQAAQITQEWDRRHPGQPVGISLPPRLPTRDATIIEPRWRPGVTGTYHRLVLSSGQWWVVGVASWHGSSDELRAMITGFEIVVEP